MSFVEEKTKSVEKGWKDCLTFKTYKAIEDKQINITSIMTELPCYTASAMNILPPKTCKICSAA